MSLPEEVIYLDPELESRLRSDMRAEDVTPPLLTLVRAAIAVHEHAFHYADIPKQAVLTFMSAAWDAGEYQRKISSKQVDGAQSAERYSGQLQNIARGAVAAREFAFNNPDVTKETFLAFMSTAWDIGEHQRKVYSMEVEGKANNDLGVAMNFACHLALFGEREGLLPKAKAAAA